MNITLNWDMLFLTAKIIAFILISIHVVITLIYVKKERYYVGAVERRRWLNVACFFVSLLTIFPEGFLVDCIRKMRAQKKEQRKWNELNGSRG